MKKPYIVCHMMTSLDGRIDCAMTEQLPGVDDYYQTLEALRVPTTVSGRVTAQLEMALPGEFQAGDPTPVGKEAFSRKADAPGYEIVVDTHGKLLWPDAGEPEKPLLILTSEQAPREYLTYLDSRNISWIAGKTASDPHQRAGAPGISDLPGRPEHLLDCCRKRADRPGPGRRDPGGGVRGGAHGNCGRLRHQHQLLGRRPAGRGQHPHRRRHRRPGRYAGGVR